MEILQTLSISELRIDHHQSEYTCVATNIIGDSSDSIILNITCNFYAFCGSEFTTIFTTFELNTTNIIKFQYEIIDTNC